MLKILFVRKTTLLVLAVTLFFGIANQNSAEAATDCTLSGVTILDGQSRYFYSTQWVSSFQAETCASPSIRQLRTCNNGVLSGSYVFTDCSKGTTDNLTKFTIIGDSRSDSTTVGSRLQTVVDALETWGSHMHYIVSTGDIYDCRYYTGTTATNRARFQLAPLASYLTTSMSTNRLWNAMGNHEYYGNNSGSIYDSIFPYPQRHYDIIKGPVHFLFVDLSEAYFAEHDPDFIITGVATLETQKAWLKDKLKYSTSMWKIVVAHYPHGVDFSSFNWDWYGMGVDVVLTGHVHAYLRYTDRYGVRYFINGSGGCYMNGNACLADSWVQDRLKTSDEYGIDLEITINECIDKDIAWDDIYGYQRIVADERYMDFSFFDTSGTGHGAQLDNDIVFSSDTKGIRDNSRKSDLLKIATALDEHFLRYGSFTQPETVYSDCSTGQYGAEGCGRGDDWAANSDLRVLLADNDIDSLPVDPINSSIFHYQYEPFNVDANHPASGWGYWLCASKLEMTGTQYCIRVERATEVCDDGIDNDLDGLTDSWDPNCGAVCGPGDQQPCGESEGACEQGLRTCLNGQWGPCEGELGPTEEVCDGQDNNCDGSTDENARPEICDNGIDDDCDGLIDGMDPDCGDCTPGEQRDCGTDEGECRMGRQLCNAYGQWGECGGGLGPEAEDCDLLDNDCDGITDEGQLCPPGEQCDENGHCVVSTEEPQDAGTDAGTDGGDQSADEGVDGSTDAGPDDGADQGGTADEGVVVVEGCGCGVGGSPRGLGALLLVLGLFLLRRIRRR